MKSKHWLARIFVFLLMVFSTSACTGEAAPGFTPTITPPPTDIFEAAVDILTATSTPTEESEATSTVASVPEETKEISLANPLPPDPIPQSFQTSDGVELSGMFYPAAEVNAPLIVLFHWAHGDQSAWGAIAPWLQNRIDLAELPETSTSWLDVSWFPSMTEEVTYNVFTFTFRGCEGGCQSFDREGWLLDAEAVMTYVSGLENVDLSRVAAIGASIGADGAVIGCYAYNRLLGGCLGALSLSPGGYLTRPYPEEVADLGAETPPRPAWCLYSAGDAEAAAACESAKGAHYQVVSYTDAAHGFAMIEPNRDPDPLMLILDFLSQIGL